MVERSRLVYSLRCGCAILNRGFGGEGRPGWVLVRVEVEVRSSSGWWSLMCKALPLLICVWETF